MLLNIRYNKDGKISEAVQSRITQKMKKIKFHLEVDHPVHVIIESQKSGEEVEVSFHFKGHDIIAKDSGKNLYEAIDAAVAHAERQFNKIVSKMKNHKGDASLKDLEVRTSS